jgi:lysophospholipase L1-like esterase
MKKFNKILINILLAVVSVVISLIIIEIFLRIFDNEKYYIWPPYTKLILTPNSKILPGINGTSNFSINSEGFRSDEPDGKSEINILVLGGSTTECLYLDQNETWTYLLEKKINESVGNKFYVMNGGRSGLNSFHFLLQTEKILEQFKWINTIIIMPGINDLQYALSLGNQYKPVTKESCYDGAFLVSPLNTFLPFYKRTQLFTILSKVKRNYSKSELYQDATGEVFNIWWANRRNAVEYIDSLPDLESSLTDYANNLKGIIDIAKQKNKKIIFLTQPVIWNDSISEQYSRLCWYGWIGESQYSNSGKYYTIKQLYNGIKKYNDVTIKVCNENNINYLELEKMLSKDTTTFIDDCHFNESGAKKVSQIIFKYLLEKKLFEK